MRNKGTFENRQLLLAVPTKELGEELERMAGLIQMKTITGTLKAIKVDGLSQQESISRFGIYAIVNNVIAVQPHKYGEYVKENGGSLKLPEFEDIRNDTLLPNNLAFNVSKYSEKTEDNKALVKRFTAMYNAVHSKSNEQRNRLYQSEKNNPDFHEHVEKHGIPTLSEIADLGHQKERLIHLQMEYEGGDDCEKPETIKDFMNRQTAFMRYCIA